MSFDAEKMWQDHMWAGIPKEIVIERLKEAYERGRRDENEEAAKIAEDYEGHGTDHDYYSQLGDSSRTKSDIAKTIRARYANKVSMSEKAQ